MALGPFYRFVALNSLGQTVASGWLTIRAKRWNFSSTGVQTFNDATPATIYSSAATPVNGAYDTSMSPVTNTSSPNLGGTFEVTVIAPASSSGTVTIYLQRSVDGTTWPDNGKGTVLRTFSFSATGTQVDDIEI